MEWPRRPISVDRGQGTPPAAAADPQLSRVPHQDWSLLDLGDGVSTESTPSVLPAWKLKLTTLVPGYDRGVQVNVFSVHGDLRGERYTFEFTRASGGGAHGTVHSEKEGFAALEKEKATGRSHPLLPRSLTPDELRQVLPKVEQRLSIAEADLRSRRIPRFTHSPLAKLLASTRSELSLVRQSLAALEGADGAHPRDDFEG